MTVKTLRERIENAEKKIQRKESTIAKKQKWIDDKTAKLATLTDDHERYCMECDIKWLADDIRCLGNEIKETQKTLEKYQKQLEGEIKRESDWVSEVPELLKALQNELVEKWDAYDIKRRERIKKEYHELPYSEFSKKYKHSDWEFMYATDEQIHNSNERDATDLILNLINRVKHVTGEITDWSHISLSGGVLNGYVTGKEGRCCVETIVAGGYNIQRLHIRVLVKQMN